MEKYTVKVLICRDCNNEFVFTSPEQEFYKQKGFYNPNRCPNCRAIKRAKILNRETFNAYCSKCGKETIVPFQPSGDRPVYCHDCHKPARRETRPDSKYMRIETAIKAE